MKLFFAAALLITATLPFTTAVIAEDEHHAMPTEVNVMAQFSPEIQELLSKEMTSIQESMMKMVPAIAAGEWDRVERLAGGIAMGHIMKQKLTGEQKKSLHDGLPMAFKVLDNRFHDYAGMLAHVTRERHTELTTFYFYKLTETCLACHSKFAKKRFPGLTEPSNMHRPKAQKTSDQHAKKPHQH